ncbi:hypothetical protein NC652_011643 [Populus alba x Populus x berolinensis]|nr:hypothetical protein NC652_011643 [Populus alba x Populus x berolinensis]
MNEDIVDTGQDISPCFGWESWNVGSYNYQKEFCGNQMIFREMRSNNYMFSGGGHFPSDVRMRYVIQLLVVCVLVVVVIPKLETWLSGLSCKSTKWPRSFGYWYCTCEQV